MLFHTLKRSSWEGRFQSSMTSTLLLFVPDTFQGETKMFISIKLPSNAIKSVWVWSTWHHYVYGGIRESLDIKSKFIILTVQRMSWVDLFGTFPLPHTTALKFDCLFRIVLMLIICNSGSTKELRLGEVWYFSFLRGISRGMHCNSSVFSKVDKNTWWILIISSNNVYKLAVSRN